MGSQGQVSSITMVSGRVAMTVNDVTIILETMQFVKLQRVTEKALRVKSDLLPDGSETDCSITCQ